MTTTDQDDSTRGEGILSRRAMTLGLLAAAGTFLASCRVKGPPLLRPPLPGVRPARARRGPPAHAPAHGYRRKHRSGHSLVFDAPLGVYAVVGLPGIYFHDGLFLRRRRGVWYSSGHPRKGWRRGGGRGLPRGLARKYGRGGPRKRARRRGRGRGRGRN